jgi:hypothetical protein
MNVSQGNIFYKGDTIELEFQLFKNKATNEYWNLGSHQIRFQLQSSPNIKKATSNVSGGSDEQINITNPTQGIFVVIITGIVIPVGEYEYEIEVTTPSPNPKHYTVLRSTIRIVEDFITWESIT